MIDPRNFLSSKEEEPEENLEDIEGSFSCPQQTCYSYTTYGKFNKDTRVVTWVCENGHKGAALL